MDKKWKPTCRLFNQNLTLQWYVVTNYEKNIVLGKQYMLTIACVTGPE